MTRSALLGFLLVTVPAVAVLLLQAASCGVDDSDGGGGGGGGGGGNQPPVVVASPDGGSYNNDQIVAINSNESATIFYTTDGSTPQIGGATTFSDEAPVTNLLIGGTPGAETTRTLSFFGVDSEGLASALVVEIYLIDRSLPSIFQGGDPAPIGVFESASVSWSCDDDGTFLATLGGDGTPGTGIEVSSGIYPTPGTPASIVIAGSLLELGATDVPLHLFFMDSGGNEGSAQWSVSLHPLVQAAVPTGSGEIVVAEGADRAFVIEGGANRVLGFDATSGAPDGMIAVSALPNGLALLPDESVLYVSCQGAIDKIDVATSLVTATLPVAGGIPSGLAATPDGARVYFTTSDGALSFIDTSDDSIDPTSVSGQLWSRSVIAITPDAANARAAIAWTGANAYSVEVFDVVADALLPDPLADLQLSPLPPGRVVAANALGSQIAFAGGIGNSLTRFDLDATPAIGQSVIPPLATGGLAITQNDSHLLLSSADSLTLEFRDPADLFTVLGGYDLSVAADALLVGTGVGPSMQAANGDDGVLRLYLVKNPDTGSAELLGVPLQ